MATSRAFSPQSESCHLTNLVSGVRAIIVPEKLDIELKQETHPSLRAISEVEL